ncbi:peptidoglycan binding [Homalodisca vitripennis]|nr:peptidoglycan binding [Homalodisca vitripennis]
MTSPLVIGDFVRAEEDVVASVSGQVVSTVGHSRSDSESSLDDHRLLPVSHNTGVRSLHINNLYAKSESLRVGTDYTVVVNSGREEIVPRLISYFGWERRNLGLYDTIFGLHHKWYFLIVTLVTISVLTCLVSGVVFSFNFLVLSDDKSPPPPTNLKESVSEEVVVLQKWVWYLLIAMVSLSCLNLVSTAMLAYDKFKKPNPRLSDYVDSVPRHLLIMAPRIMNRRSWNAAPPLGTLDVNRLPVKMVVVTHTETEPCSSPDLCREQINSLQRTHMGARDWLDIAYNFLIGEDGSVYIGRGWDFLGSHTKGHNVGNLGVALMGTFAHLEPTNEQMEALRKLIQLGVKMNKISDSYSLVCQCQLQVVDFPEVKLMEKLKSWERFQRDLPVIRRSEV